MNKSMSDRILEFLKTYAVTIMFFVLCLVFMKLSRQSFNFIVGETITRLLRNAVLVLSLLIPVLCGLGLNFSIVLGAMAGQIGLFVITHYGIGGINGLIIASVIGVVLSVAFGYATGRLYNRTVGQEMITGMIVGFFAKGIYQLVFLVLLGPVIPMKNPEMMISNGIGLKNTIALDGVKNTLESIFFLKLNWFILLCACIMLVVTFIAVLLKSRRRKISVSKAALKSRTLIIASVLVWLAYGSGMMLPAVHKVYINTNIPLVTVAVIVLFCLFNTFISSTKLGQDFRTVGQDLMVARASGINVAKTRIIAVILSTAIASIGQIIYLQSMGVVTTYSSQDNVGTYAVAALLVGGASIKKANIGHVFLGIVMFHILFFTTPLVGMYLFNDSQIGEYFRVFICYGIIAVSLVLYVFKENMERRKETRELAEQENTSR